MYHEISNLDIHKYNPKAVKRIYITKNNNGCRPIGIPTIKDRCIQAMVKNCLEPEWEAVFESTSYGFRPGRSPHDALSRIYNTLSVKRHGNNRKNWILDADIEGFFDNVSHNDIMEKLDNFPMKNLIEKWLKAGYMELNKFHSTELGTPQGGIISPLLANIALTDLANFLKTEPDSTGRVRGSRVYVRYADDFVILCSSLKEARQTHIEIATWLKSRGLKISSNKTRIINVSDGFDFLGINIRQYETKAVSKVKGKVLLMKPSRKSISSIKQKLRYNWSFLRGKSIITVLNKLNPIIIGWRNYFKKYVSVNTFKKLDNWTYLKSQNYASRIHPNKGKRWIYDKYFGNFVSTRKDRWVFGNKSTGNYLQKFAWAKIQRNTMVKGHNSIYDPKLKEY
jgi:RNA-directed DNA polymerase